MAARSGLVSYGGDSEISDSEDERISLSASPSGTSDAPLNTSVPTNTLGIPSSERPAYTPPSLPSLKVEAAPTPSSGLVDYTIIEDEDERNNSNKLSDIENVEDGSSQSSNDAMEETQLDERSPKVVEDQYSIPLFFPTAKTVLPPEPTAKYSKQLQQKIVTLLQKKVTTGIDMNSSLQLRKDLRNPSIYEKLVQFCGIDEFGSEYPEHLYNPKEFSEESKYDNLYKEQQKTHAKERAKQIEFVTGTKRTIPNPSAANDKPDGSKKRRTKWDVGTNSADSGGSRGTSPTSIQDRPAILGNPPGLQPRVLQVGPAGPQVRVQLNQNSQEFKKNIK